MTPQKLFYTSRRRLKLVVAVSIGALFLAVVNYFIYSQLQDRMLQDSRMLADSQMGHLQDEVKAALQDGNYQSADNFLKNWGRSFPDVSSLKLIARNGAVLSEFSREIKGGNFMNLEREITYSYKGKVRLVMAKGLGYVDAEMEKLLWQLAFISSIALMVFGTLVNEILHRRQVEDEIRKSNEELELNISERTNQLRHEVEERKAVQNDLLIAKETAENATRAKSEFLANMSHELRTPLNAILGYSQAISMETFGPVENKKYVEYLQIIHDSGDHLLGLINEVLDISAIEAGKLTLTKAPIDIAGIIEAMIILNEPKANEKQLRVTHEVDGQLPELYADEQRVRQIILNLLSNATRYTREGGQIEVKAGTDENNHVCISVLDTGIGMSDENIKTALEPFGQVRDSRVGDNMGTGLGLPLVKTLTELHDGTFEINSTVDSGTTVTVCFPPR